MQEGTQKKQSVANRKQHPLPTYHCHAICSLVRGQEYGKCACFSTICFDVRPIAVRYLCLPGRSQKGQPTFGLPQSWSKFQPRAQNKKVRPELGTPTSVARISLLDIPFRLERTQKENRCSGGPNPKQRLRAIQMSVFLAFLRGPPNILVFPQGVLSTPPPKHWGSSKKKNDWLWDREPRTRRRPDRSTGSDRPGRLWGGGVVLEGTFVGFQQRLRPNASSCELFQARDGYWVGWDGGWSASLVFVSCFFFLGETRRDQGLPNWVDLETHHIGRAAVWCPYDATSLQREVPLASQKMALRPKPSHRHTL